MATFLFDEIVFGPVRSRRLGISLGINLLPTNHKLCNFNCLYCECGWSNEKIENLNTLPSLKLFYQKLEDSLSEMYLANKKLDAITFAGNGEPTLHPEFDKIIDATIELRQKYFPDTKITVLSNATLIANERIFNALQKVEQSVLKLDSAILETIKLLNSPPENYALDNLIDNFLRFKGNFVLQTMFIKGEYNGQKFDNTSELEVSKWIEIVNIIRPKLVMIYTIARDTPAKNIIKIQEEMLERIAEKVREIGIAVSVTP